MIRVRSLVGICLFLLSTAVVQAEEKCKVEDRDLTIFATEVLSGEPFSAFVFLDKHESVHWEVRGGTILSTSDGYVTIQAGGPGTLEIDAFVSRNEKKCELKISASVPVICPSDPDRYMYVSHTTAEPGDVVGAFANVFEGETLQWQVRGGTIASTNDPNVSIIAGAPGTLEIDAIISKGACSFTVTRTVPIACQDDPTIGLFFDTGGVSPGGVVNAWANLREGTTAHWEIVNGTPSSADGQSVQITAGASGLVEINLYVTLEGGYCTIHRRAFIFIHAF